MSKIIEHIGDVVVIGEKGKVTFHIPADMSGVLYEKWRDKYEEEIDEFIETLNEK